MTTTILLTIVFFLAVILMLVSLLLFAKARLSPSGTLKLVINGEQTLEVEGGSTLLTTLGNAGVFLPSACGGGGTCVQCRCQVPAVEATILPYGGAPLLAQGNCRQLAPRLPSQGQGGHGNPSPRRSLWHQKVGMRSGLQLQRGLLH